VDIPHPAVSLKAARQKREEAKELLAPGAHKQAVKAAVRAEWGFGRSRLTMENAE